MGWTRVEVHADDLNARLAVIENEVRALLGEHTPKGVLSSVQIHFADDSKMPDIPVMISKGTVYVFKM